jgi:hypothetical protein
MDLWSETVSGTHLLGRSIVWLVHDEMSTTFLCLGIFAIHSFGKEFGWSPAKWAPIVNWEWVPKVWRSIKTMTVLWSIVLGYGVVHTIYEDHQKLLTNISSKRTEISKLQQFKDAVDPPEGEIVASPPLAEVSVNIVQRDPKTDIPFHVNVGFIANTQITDTVPIGFVYLHDGDASAYEVNSTFRQLHVHLATAAPEEYMQVSPGRVANFTIGARPGAYVPDASFQKVIYGGLRLYVLASWRYAIPNSSSIYYADFCAYFNSNLAVEHHCNTHNVTYVTR